MVGDPKQSIYGFRRADPETYGTFTQSVLREGGRQELLVDQYRSTPELVAALNAIGPPLFTTQPADRDLNVFQPEYHALRAARTAEGGCRPLTFLASDGEAESEAEAIAAWIRAQDESDLRKFALLFRRRGRMEVYLDVFDRQKLPYVVPPMGLFLDRPAAVDLMSVLRAIAYAYDRGALISAARSPYFALTDAEVVKQDEPPWTEFLKSLDAFRDASRHLTVTELIDHVVKTTAIEAIYNARVLRHLEQVRTIAFSYDQKVGGSVRQFVEEIARRREVPEEVEPSLLDDTTNAVRILTIHGAKGLEFETVILPDIEFHTGSNSSVDLFTVEDPPSLVIRNGLDTLSGICRYSDNRPLKEIGSLRDKAETRRLFYVAITRAKSQVAIVCKPDVSNRGFGKFVKEIFGEIHFEQQSGGQTILSVQTGTIACPPLAPCVVPQPAEITPILPRDEIAIARRGSANRAAGILLHRVLERWDGTSDVSLLLAALAIEQAADKRAVDLVRRRITQVTGSNIFRRIMSAETIGREMPIAFIDDSGALLARRIDRLIRENGTDTVVDYKSGEPSEARLQRDREQVALYCGVIAQMTGRQCRGLLWYIDAENDTAIDV